MFGIIVVTHGELAAGFLHASKMIVGEVEKFTVLGFKEGENIDDYREKTYQQIMNLKCKNVLALCDLFGASPYNVVLQNYPKLKKTINYRIISGANLPMVIESILERDNYNNLDNFTKHIADIGKNAIQIQNFNF